MSSESVLIFKVKLEAFKKYCLSKNDYVNNYSYFWDLSKEVFIKN